ncbi:MAG: hypothetical protein GY943_05820 [Chloroflexi bacterium]|nr:hypothetical protein [Chloroflexota bacterium]
MSGRKNISKLGKAVLNSKEFSRWVESIYNTNEDEFDCQTTQSMLPEYVESIIEKRFTDTIIENQLNQHFQNCKECKEVFDGLKFVVEQELVSEGSMAA